MHEWKVHCSLSYNKYLPCLDHDTAMAFHEKSSQLSLELWWIRFFVLTIRLGLTLKEGGTITSACLNYGKKTMEA